MMQNKFNERIAKLRTMFSEKQIDALLICKPSNVSYYTGTKGDDCRLYITPDEAFIITDFRYEEMARSLTWLTFFETTKGNGLLEFMKSRKEKTVGVEDDSFPLDWYLKFKNELNNTEIRTVSFMTEKLRMIKDDDELETISHAERIGDEAFKDLLKVLKPGMTEKEVATELEYAMRKHGADGFSFDTIAVSGPNSSSPHGVPTDRILKNGDFLTLDFGCIYNLYCSDMTRTVSIGKPTDEMKKVYNIVLLAQLTACDKIKAGIKGFEGHKLAADVIERAGYGDRFGHGLGHSVGLQIHEAPNFNPSCDMTICENMVLSIEPGIYLPGKFGVRIEDLAIIKSNGIINLAHSPKELIVV